MNCIECFNRSRDGLQVCSSFFFVWCLDVSRRGVLQPVPLLRRSWCLDAARCGVLQPVPFAPCLACLDAARRGRIAAVPFAPVWCASMLPGVEYCRRALCAFLVCLDAARRGRIAAVPFAPVWCASMLPGVEYCRRALCAFLVPRCCQVWSVARCTFCARPGAFLVPTLLRYTYYSISQILELFAADPTPGSSL